MASKRRNMFHKNKTQETTEKGWKGVPNGGVQGHRRVNETLGNLPTICVIKIWRGDQWECEDVADRPMGSGLCHPPMKGWGAPLREAWADPHHHRPPCPGVGEKAHIGAPATPDPPTILRTHPRAITLLHRPLRQSQKMGRNGSCLLLWALLAVTPVIGSARYGPLPRAPLYTPRTAFRPQTHYAPPYYAPQEPFPQVVDFYYPLDPYDKYRLYQVPYYYPEPPLPYFLPEDDASLEDDLSSEEEEAPYGQETWYADRKDANAEANALFLHNLILAQMYKDAAASGAYRYYPGYYGGDEWDEGYVYGEPVADPTAAAVAREQEEVRQLKSLAEDRHQPPLERSKHDTLFGDQRRRAASTATASAQQRLRYPANEWRPDADKRNAGSALQEEPQYRQPPALPSPTPTPHQPSVYDSIKKLLHMQDRLEQKNESRPQKRSYIPSEESLVEQLDSLKKSA
ncbi:hypothetical protein AAG570_007010 [Ranatra chinensis]|uniref:Uncharacterized protein n=1 Tax=Ranatra chinensis TaxID=642074 RepID=A0ABD0ZGW6_9HEMI